MAKGTSMVGIGSIEELSIVAEKFPLASFELSYNRERDGLEGWLNAVEGRIASIHSLSPMRSFFPNFASPDKDVVAWSHEQVLEDADLAKRIGAGIIVLHPGYLVPGLVPTSVSERSELLSKSGLERFVSVKKGSICTRTYIEEPEYRLAFSSMVENLSVLSNELDSLGVKLAVENLNPRAGYLLVHPSEMLELARTTNLSFCLDVGHMLVSSALFGFDFLSSVASVLETGRVVTVHMHSNPSKAGVYEDSHQSIRANGFPFREVLELVERSGANLMLETLGGIEGGLLDDLGATFKTPSCVLAMPCTAGTTPSATSQYTKYCFSRFRRLPSRQSMSNPHKA